MSLSILVIDDEHFILELMRMRLSKWGYTVETASSGQEGLDLLKERPVEIVVTDLMMPGLSGAEVVKQVKARHPETEVLVITAYGTVESAVEVMKAGAYDFFLKPLNFPHIKITLKKIEETLALRSENASLAARYQELQGLLEDRYVSFSGMIGRCPALQKIFQLVRTIQDVDSSVLITGETGTGKEQLARTIHFNSVRKEGPFVALDCAAVPETLLESELFGHEKGAFTGAVSRKHGRFERAHGGTLFLDEIGNTSHAVQQKLLRVIQEKAFERVGGERLTEVDVRIISATNRDMEKEMQEGRFRQDLYYRLNVIPIILPPLRERKEDIPLLANHFVSKYAERFKRPVDAISDEVLHKLEGYFWPGNVRELENIIERAVIMTRGSEITDVELPSHQSGMAEDWRLDTKSPLREVRDRLVQELESAYLAALLKEFSGNIRRTSERAGIDEKTLYNKMKLYRLSKETFKQ